MSQQHIPHIYITSIPYIHRTYYQWLIYGLYELKEKGEISLSFSKMPLRDMLMHQSSRFRKMATKYLKPRQADGSYCLQGFVIFHKRRISFCYDIADSPFLFDIVSLSNVDYYFKAQCPKEISSKGFPLSSQISIPFLPNIISLKEKIMPAMIGPRCMYPGNIFHFEKMRDAYNRMLHDKSSNKEGLLMCYFGSALGPVPSPQVSAPDFNSESDILGYFREKVNHPNEKRAIAADYISQLGIKYDSRLINPGNSDSDNQVERKDLIVPLSEFCKHISNFQYNLNISGYRNSIPNRFIESFAVGTAILTDRLFVKWYLPFGCEVRESVEMSYLPAQKIDWEKFKIDIASLPSTSEKEVLDAYNKKWSPIAFAQYVVKKIIS